MDDINNTFPSSTSSEPRPVDPIKQENSQEATPYIDSSAAFSVNGRTDDMSSKPATTTDNMTSADSKPSNDTGVAASLQNAGQAALNTASATVTSVSNSQVVQDLKNGPVAQNVSKEASKTSSEMKDLYGSRTVPSTPAATGQSLTHYHSMFYRLLSWQNPRATAITFIGTVLFIFAARYMNILRYAFKFAYFILGVTASLEIAGKLIFDDGLASKMRPRKYWTIPRESLERSLDDVEQLINFFVIESQRILYAENVWATVGVFLSALISYWLIKLVPFWGLCLISTCVFYLLPLVYIKNRETIDDGLEQVGNIARTQANQIKNITAEHTGKATQSIKSYAGEYTSKAQGFVNSKRANGIGGTTSTSTGTSNTTSNPTLRSNGNAIRSATSATTSNDFPSAPKTDPITTGVPSSTETEPLLAH